MFLNKSNSEGMTLLEFIFMIPLFFILLFGIIEIARVYSFKLYLQTITNDAVIFLAHAHLNILSLDRYEKERLEDTIRKNLEKKISNFPTINISLNQAELNDLKNNTIYMALEFINTEHKEYPKGVYLKINACLPVFFPTILNNLFDNNINIGKSVNSKEKNKRNCLGHFLGVGGAFPGLFFRIRSAAYFPWPASSNIFINGLYLPDKFLGLENVDEKQKENFFKQDLSLVL